jgi:hypothetical protein
MRLYGIGFALIALRKILISMTCDYSYLVDTRSEKFSSSSFEVLI